MYEETGDGVICEEEADKAMFDLRFRDLNYENDYTAYTNLGALIERFTKRHSEKNNLFKSVNFYDKKERTGNAKSK
ncbi:hypothetical protein CHS0354_035851 [Potamilus streckersoni]|uniref:Uncharacterized protein n=1 Tax=Potamilus streckersoni TaxID=2493646 RepID=A0AAE0W458_9BIVA|nr:hypothetical protein CHS0354_035851 [Potamilus streckersoni]